jgi:hypothetical protein
VYLHCGFNQWNPTISPDPAMSWNAGDSRWQSTVMVSGSATQLDVVFNNGGGAWDNNSGADWHFQVTGGTTQQWVMDGQLDADAKLVAQNGVLQLYAGLKGTTLYIAAADAGEGNDHFIFLASPPGTLRAAPWAKAGQVAGWAAYLANETDNMWVGWQDASAETHCATGGGTGWLEGTIDLVQELGQMPNRVYLAFAAYGTHNGDALVAAAQVPPSINSDGNVDAAEYAVFSLLACSDRDGDGDVDLADFTALAGCLTGPNHGPLGTGCRPFDCSGDDDLDLEDFASFQRMFSP